MQYKAIKGFLHDQLGSVEKDQVFDGAGYNLSPVERFIEPYQTKVVAESPAQREQAHDTKSRKRGRPRKPVEH